MNENAVIEDLKYIDEHLSCMNYRLNIQTGFRYETFEKGSTLNAPCISMNYIVFFLEGEYTLTCHDFGNMIFKENQMICLPKGTDIHANTTTGGRVIIMGFDTPKSSCDKQIFIGYNLLCNNEKYKMEPTPIISSLITFLNLLEYYLRNQMNCVHLHDLKHKEFFLLLRGYYTKEQIAYFLYPAICNLSNFRYFVKTTFHKADTIEDLIKLSNYSRPVFYRKFKAEFGDISPQEWMLQQRKPHVLEVATIPGMTAKEMMIQLNLNSISTLERLCSELFDCTPTQLIKSIKQENRQ